jgi:hypothetical protein
MDFVQGGVLDPAARSQRNSPDLVQSTLARWQG